MLQVSWQQVKGVGAETAQALTGVTTSTQIDAYKRSLVSTVGFKSTTYTNKQMERRCWKS